MIFSPDLAAKVIAGEKTVTRRRVKFDSDGSTIPCRYVAGRTYAVQPGRGKKAIGRILIAAVWCEGHPHVRDIPEARREGFGSPAEFWAYWLKLHDGPYCPVWRIEFVLDQGEGES